MPDKATTAVIQRYLDALQGDASAEPIIRTLLERAVSRLRVLCAAFLHQKYPRLTQPPLNLDTDELLDGNLANDYRPILSFGEGKWLHGLPAARQPAIYLSRNELSSPRVSGVVR